MYTVIDIIDKFIEIEKIVAKIYEDISKQSNEVNNLKIIAQTLAKEEYKHVLFYEELKNKLVGREDLDVDFDIYDKISKLMIEFKNSLINIDGKNVSELLNQALIFEKDNKALLLNIRGRLVRQETDVEKGGYEALSKIIDEEEHHIRDLEKIIAYRK